MLWTDAAAQTGNSPMPETCAPPLSSLATFNQLLEQGLVEDVYVVKAYFVILLYPQCKPGGECPPIAALISDTPRSCITNEKVKALIDRVSAQNVKEIEKTLNELRAGYVFRALDINYEKFRHPQSKNPLEAIYKLSIRKTDAPRHRTGFVLEGFSELVKTDSSRRRFPAQMKEEGE
ncbi:MAG: hypothetical protein LBU53_07045 [Zoogloeaceae bacterium]|nr:hypothetical protein [Zoogloeaceae bacterium]